jgi:kelch-like protein 20
VLLYSHPHPHPPSSDKHAKFLLENLNLLRKQKELSYVILIVGQNKIPAHRAVLSACSPYFKAMFTEELAESRQTEIIIHDIDEYAREFLIEYCYTSRIVVDEKNSFIYQKIENFKLYKTVSFFRFIPGAAKVLQHF